MLPMLRKTLMKSPAAQIELPMMFRGGELYTLEPMIDPHWPVIRKRSSEAARFESVSPLAAHHENLPSGTMLGR